MYLRVLKISMAAGVSSGRHYRQCHEMIRENPVHSCKHPGLNPLGYHKRKREKRGKGGGGKEEEVS